MAETTYTYSIADDFPATGLNSSRLKLEIEQSAIITALDRIDTDGDVCNIIFKDALSAGDKTILDGDTTAPAGGLIAAHTAEGIITPDGVQLYSGADTPSPQTFDGSPIFAEQRLTLGQAAFLRTDNATEAMDIDGGAGGTPLSVWDGTGAGDTGADWSVAGTGSESASADAGSGTNGWDTGVTALDDGTTWDNGSLIDVNGLYANFTFQMNPQAFPATSRPRVVFLDASNNQIGNSLRIDDYTTNMDLGVWQQVTIPIADFALTANVQKIRFRYRNTAGQHYYFDDLQLVPSGGGGPYIFRVEAPDANTRYHVSMMVLVLSGAATGWNSTTFANITTLTNGLLLRQRRISDGEVLWRLNSKDNVDLFGRFHPQDDIEFADGTLLVGFMVKPGKASVIVTDDEVLEVVVRDNLSGLDQARAYVHYGVEVAA